MRRRHQNFLPSGGSPILVSRTSGRGLSQYIARSPRASFSGSGMTPEAAVATLLRRLAVQQASQL